MFENEGGNVEKEEKINDFYGLVYDRWVVCYWVGSYL